MRFKDKVVILTAGGISPTEDCRAIIENVIATEGSIDVL